MSLASLLLCLLYIISTTMAPVTRNGQHSQQNPWYTTQFLCSRCHFASVDVAGIRHHVNSHMLEEAISLGSPHQMVPIQQLRERNLLFNPFRQLLPSPDQSTTRTSGSNHLQMQRSPQSSEAWKRLPIQTQIVEAAKYITRDGTEETTQDPTLPLLDQFDQPIPVIIDLDDDQNDDSDQFDLDLRL